MDVMSQRISTCVPEFQLRLFAVTHFFLLTDDSLHVYKSCLTWSTQWVALKVEQIHISQSDPNSVESDWVLICRIAATKIMTMMMINESAGEPLGLNINPA